MHLYRQDRGALARLAGLETGAGTDALVLHPPDRTTSFADASALATAYQTRALTPLPSNAAALGVTVAPAMGAGRGAPRALYRGLRPAALRLLIALAARVRELSGGHGTLRLAGTATDVASARRVGDLYPAAATGFSLQLERRYDSRAQPLALQAALDRLQSLNLIAWTRDGARLDLTVAGDAAAWLAR